MISGQPHGHSQLLFAPFGGVRGNIASMVEVKRLFDNDNVEIVSIFYAPVKR